MQLLNFALFVLSASDAISFCCAQEARRIRTGSASMFLLFFVIILIETGFLICLVKALSLEGQRDSYCLSVCYIAPFSKEFSMAIFWTVMNLLRFAIFYAG